MPTTIRTMHTRLKQMRNLLAIWTALSVEERYYRLGGIRLETLSIRKKSRIGVDCAVNLTYYK